MTDVTRKPTWTMKRQRSSIANIMDSKKRKISDILASVHQDGAGGTASIPHANLHATTIGHHICNNSLSG